jgi:enoyl-CoA hydratase/carnithine racemase
MSKAQGAQNRARSNETTPADKVQLTYADDDAIAIITLNDPALGNPMSPDMAEAFASVVRSLEGRQDLKAAIVQGAGKDFSVGGHRDMLTHLASASMTAKARHDFMLGFYDHWLSLLDIPVPVISAIEGACIGVAPIFACVSDICIADETANFQITFAGLGLYPGMAMSYVLPKLIGPQRTALLMVGGAPFSGREAFELGLVARCVPKGTVREEAMKTAREISGNVAGVVRPLTCALRTKRSDLQAALESDAARQAESYSTPAFREQIAKYLPDWYEK